MRLQILFLAVLLALIHEYHCEKAELNQTEWDWDKNYEVTTPKSKYNDNYNNNYNNDDNYDDSYDNNRYYNEDDDDNYKPSDYSPSKNYKPDSYGNMNIYFREPSKDGKRKKPKRIRFPVHRFERNRFPPFPPLISFLPWLPIFADRLTKQTIIFSPTGGLYIIPPVINFYGQRFAIAELIVSGYASLVSSGAPPPPAVNVAPLVQPGAVTGPGIPPPNPSTGGFKGGVRTEYRSFPRPKFPKRIEQEGGADEEQNRNSGGGYGY